MSVAQRVYRRLLRLYPAPLPAMKIPLLRGRFFNAGDGPDAPPVAIVNSSTAKRYWPGFPAGEDPIGKRYTTDDPGPQARWLTIVGIVADTRRAGVDQPVFTESYQPLAQSPALRIQIVVRTALPAGAVKAAVESALHGLDRDVPVASLVPVETALGERMASRRFTMLLLSLFAATALLIAGVGIYGLISYLVTQRRPEFGVRLALGAQPVDVLRLVAGRVMAMAAAGLALGIAGALVLTRALQTLLFGVTRFDPQSYALAGAGLLLVGLAAAVSPAIRALRMGPLETLRAE